jgi:nitrate reductase NapE component
VKIYREPSAGRNKMKKEFVIDLAIGTPIVALGLVGAGFILLKSILDKKYS